MPMGYTEGTKMTVQESPLGANVLAFGGDICAGSGAFSVCRGVPNDDVIASAECPILP